MFYLCSSWAGCDIEFPESLIVILIRRILSPCVGLDSLGRAALELQIPMESTGDYDLNMDLKSTVALLRGGHEECLHFGRVQGDICSVDLGQLDTTTDGI